MKTSMAMGIVCLMLASAFVGIAMPASAEDTDMYKQVKVERGATDLMGGGEGVFLKFGNWDAAFGVLWGTNATPNNLYIVVIQARYIGLADAYDRNGAKIAGNLPLKVYTIYAVKLEDIFEFNDTNGNGIADYYVKNGDGIKYGDYVAHEPIYKGVSLKTAWTASNAKSADDPVNKTRTYQITITANNLPYFKVGNVSTAGELNKLEFTFHLRAGVMHVDNATLPHFDLTVEKGTGKQRYDVVGAKHTGPITVSGNVGKYAVKWDHLIEGWDFDATNTNKSLLMEFHALIGNFIPDEILDIAQAMKDTNDTGSARYSTDTSSGTISENNVGASWPGTMQRRIGFKMPRIDFEGNWTKVARFTWVSDVKVDGQTKNMYAQIQGGRRIVMTGPQGLFYGFGVLGGLSYPGGDKIFHDPMVESDMLLYTEKQSASRIGAIILLGMVVVIVVVVGAVAYMRMKGLGPFYRKFDDTYDRPDPKEREPKPEWDKHYKK